MELADPAELRQRSAGAIASAGPFLIEGGSATTDQISAEEHALGATLPEKYKAFLPSVCFDHRRHVCRSYRKGSRL